MNNKWKWISLIAAGAMVVALLASVFAFGLTSNAWAQDAAPDSDTRTFPGYRGARGFPAHPPVRMDNEFLLDALGINAEELQAAVEEAGKAALENAVVEGILTQEQADALLARGIYGRFGMLNGRMGFADGAENLTFLADALDISVEELESAIASAEAASVAKAVEQGHLTQEQADMMSAMRALSDYIDPQAIFEDITGMTVEQFHEARQAAYQEVIQGAVEAGVITQAQANQILAGSFGDGQDAAPFFKGRGGHHPKGFPEGMQRMPYFNVPGGTNGF
jgi:hypothetical protein